VVGDNRVSSRIHVDQWPSGTTGIHRTLFWTTGHRYLLLEVGAVLLVSSQKLSKIPESPRRSWGILRVKGFVYILGSSKVIS